MINNNNKQFKVKKITRNTILTELFNSEKLNEIINNITKGNDLKDDLKSELFLILSEMKAAKLKAAYTGNYLLYLCINILKKQYNSSTSPFHKKYRGKLKFGELYNDVVYDDDVDVNIVFEGKVLDEVRKVLNEVSYLDRELFKLYYKMDEYDRWIGEKRDTSCTKNISSSRKIERKLAIKSSNGGKGISIDHSTIAIRVKKTLSKIINRLSVIDFDE